MFDNKRNRNQQGAQASTVNQIVTDLKGRTASGAPSEQRQLLLASIVESSDDAIITKNPEGAITSWNQGAERIYGYSASEAVGKSEVLPIKLDSLRPRIRQGLVPHA